MRRQPLKKKQVTEAGDLYRSGLSLAKVSKAMGLPHESVRRALLEVGVQMRSRGRVRH
jgi:transposase-like protein